MPKVLQCVSYITIGLFCIMVAGVSFNLLYPYKTIDIQSPAPILNQYHTVAPGDTLLVEINYTKYTDKTGTVTRQFINDIMYVMPSYESNYPEGAGTTVSYTTVVPRELPPGEYYVKTSIEYEFPPFRHITYTFDTEKFCVCPGDN